MGILGGADVEMLARGCHLPGTGTMAFPASRIPPGPPAHGGPRGSASPRRGVPLPAQRHGDMSRVTELGWGQEEGVSPHRV